MDEWSGLLGYLVDLEAGEVVFDCGFRAIISDMRDEEDESTEDLDEVCSIVVKMSERPWILYLDECEDFEEGEYLH